jgi:hypothetical protein
MITGELKSQVDRLWDAFWSGGISNPLEVIEQITYLLFIKRLDDLHTAKEAKANRLKKPIENPIFNSKQQELRWSRFKHEAARLNPTVNWSISITYAPYLILHSCFDRHTEEFAPSPFPMWESVKSRHSRSFSRR